MTINNKKIRLKSYFDPTEKNMVRIAMFIKGVTGALGTVQILNDHPYLGLTILIIGAVANETINFIKYDEDSAK